MTETLRTAQYLGPVIRDGICVTSVSHSKRTSFMLMNTLGRVHTPKTGPQIDRLDITHDSPRGGPH